MVKKSGIAPLQPPTLASFRTWGIQQELVVPLVYKGMPKLSSYKNLIKITVNCLLIALFSGLNFMAKFLFILT